MFKPRKTVDGVLATFKRTLDDLKQVEQESEAEVTRQHQIAMNARLDAEAARAEAGKARNAISKLSALFETKSAEEGCSGDCAGCAA